MNMKAYRNKTTGQILAEGLNTTLTKNKFTYFKKGAGCISEPGKNWEEIEIPELKRNHSWDEVKEYILKYGEDAVSRFLNCAGVCVDSWIAFALSPDRPNDEEMEWFAETFGVSYMSQLSHSLFPFGVFDFDIVQFETLLHGFGYPRDQDISMKEFMRQRWGEDTLIRFQKIAGLYKTESLPYRVMH